ncbi:cyclin-domain-containing protein [Parathielavia hyrcaniae]|uniref:Cyclin-domain-containing protein n=1 Tax=Parathielavia hyrcaniae TaxID=113614 RepID=A0AAN6Q818_9PEZI|nr:cyclin-domain-containing protein [Parathielavia hyrcaniae]
MPHHHRLGVRHKKDFRLVVSRHHHHLRFAGEDDVGMMLARSPVPATTPTNASPRSSLHSFHYAPAPSPRHSSPRVPAVANSRRPSDSPTAAAITSTSTATSKRYVAVDAATQYSPLEPIDYATGALLPRVQPTAKPHHLSSATREAMPAPEERADAAPAVQPPARQLKAIPPGSKQRIESPSVAASPSKRRNSQGPGSSTGALAIDALQNPSTLYKRARPEAAPPKVLPLRYEHCAVEDMVVLIAHMLGELIETNDSLALKSGHLTRFHSRTAPGISVLDYLHRLAKHATLAPPLLLSMVYYIDRLCALYPDFTINTLTVHRFLITAATVAAKGLSDAFWNNSTYARIGGVKVAELKLLELEFLHRVDWKIVPNPEVLVAYYAGLVERCPGYVLEGQEPNDEDKSKSNNNKNNNSSSSEGDSSEAVDESDELDDDDVVDEGQAEMAEGGLNMPRNPSGGPSLGPRRA